jgi:D-alanyl-lipoteichoic acid acyltransferase DltB (MBOAT superfamily)
MQFVSLEWGIWMVATFSLYWLAPPSWRQATLIALTMAFLAYRSPGSLAILIAFGLLTWSVVRLQRPSNLVVVGVTLVFVAILASFKLQARGQSIESIISEGLIPLGISYYTFRCLHLVFERYRGRFAEVEPREIAGYLFFLPTIVVGPIHRFGDYQRDVHRVRFEPVLVREGLERILYGYVKIGFLANYLVNGELGAWRAQLPPTSGLANYLYIVEGGLNLYFQFSGYADIAIGFARLLGFRVIENFNWPYLQKNLSDYWRNWHISLTGWCRDYVYTTMVSFVRSPAIGALTTLIVIGLWHEISFRFIIWGLYHGFGLVIWQRFQALKPHLWAVRPKAARALLTGISTIFTVHYVWFGFVIVRKPDLAQVWDVWTAATVGFFR